MKGNDQTLQRVTAAERVKQFIREDIQKNGPSEKYYSSHYYGHQPPYTANYRNYQEPSWAKPLAEWLVTEGLFPMVDVGGAFGFLMREVARVRRASDAGADNDSYYCTVEWSDYAHQRSVSPCKEQLDARELTRFFMDRTFGTVVSMDFLEHFPPVDTADIIRQMCQLTIRGGMQVHLIGWHSPENELGDHLSDPTHLNHEDLTWYRERFEDYGCHTNDRLTEELNNHPAWRDSDWNGRWLVLERLG